MEISREVLITICAVPKVGLWAETFLVILNALPSQIVLLVIRIFFAFVYFSTAVLAS